MGTPALAAHILARVAAADTARYRLVAAITRPDQPRGRKLAMEPSEVGALAARLEIPTLKPVKIRTPEFLSKLASYEPDLIVVAAYGRILPQTILDAPRIMPMNIHASLLPRHRGASPIEGAILTGDAETGVTIMRVIEKMDAGPMLLKRAISVDADDTQGTLKKKLAELGAQALLEALDLLIRGELPETPQDESLATFTGIIEKKDAAIDWTRSAAEIERAVRAYDPWPVARTTCGGQELLIWRARIGEAGGGGETPGTIVGLKRNIVVQCGAGRLALLEVQAPGRKRIPAADYARGQRLQIGSRMGA
jgi:methionyl-tRNA formyltransferase